MSIFAEICEATFIAFVIMLRQIVFLYFEYLISASQLQLSLNTVQS